MSAFIPNIGSPFNTLPPAYDEIFPGGRLYNKVKTTQQHGDLDTKIESAARAAADCEADRKCVTLYDQQEQEQQPTEQNMSATESDLLEDRQVHKELPKLLQIGRKNNITKEQQDNLRQARAEKQKGLESDPMLFCFWVSKYIFSPGGSAPVRCLRTHILNHPRVLSRCLYCL
jgi:hypothetical protein